MTTHAPWFRCRFQTDANDPRPVKFPPPGPWWHSGSGDDFAVVIAYLKTEKQIKEYWPDATHIDVFPVDEIVYTDRFPKPDWYKP